MFATTAALDIVLIWVIFRRINSVFSNIYMV